MANEIVQINVSRQQAPIPNTLQRTGAMVSQGGTNLAPGTRSLLTAPTDYTPLTPAPLANTSLTWASSVVTVVTTAPHGFTIGATLQVTIAGAVPDEYNGTYTATVTTTTAFTYPLVANPGTATLPGTYQLGAVAEVQSMVDSFFSMGKMASVYVLELGPGTAAAGIAALQTYLVAKPVAAYAYLVPRGWDAEAAMVALAKLYESNTSKTYFDVTVTEDTYTDFVGIKSVVMMIEAPDLSPLEFSLASFLYAQIVNNPSNINKVAPFAYRFAVGMTPYPITGPQQTAWTAAGLNWIGTGAEGGIADTIFYYGTTADGRDFGYWYSVDWVQINMQLDLANEIINGSNDPTNPLYYDQPGIDRLQIRAQAVMNRGVTFGLVNNSQPPVVNAIPFITYTTDNPSDYADGQYNGMSTSYVPARGFKAIIFNITVTDFIQA